MHPRLALRLFFLVRAGRFRAMQPRPPHGASLAVIGRNPIRVLLTGAGVAAGYGVLNHEDGIAHPLAQLLAERLGQGVVIDVRSAPLLPMRSVVEFLGVNGAHGYGIVVFSPCYLEASTVPPARPKQALSRIVEHVRTTGGNTIPIVLTGMPAPAGLTKHDPQMRRIVASASGAMNAVASEKGGVTVAEMPPYASVHDPRPIDAGYYRRAAEMIATAVVDALVSPERRIGGVS